MWRSSAIVRAYSWLGVVALAACLLAVPVQAGTSADTLAATIVAKAGIHATLCEMPRAGDGTLAAALALQGIAQVHALAADNVAAEMARKPSAAARVLGSQVIIESGVPSALPLGDWVADLYVIADATDANLKTLSAAEAGRVLSPYRGVALVGNPAGGKGGLTAAALTAWANETGGTAAVSEDAGGLWAVVKMPPLKGGDDWSHYSHGADGNPVSNDTSVTPGYFAMQWHAKPIWAGKFDTYVAAGGRLFSAHGCIYWRSWTGIVPYELETRDLYNGEVLWRRPIPQTFGNLGSLLVATPDRLYLAEKNCVLCLNAETGAELSRITVTDVTQQVRWILLAKTVLLAVVGPPQNTSDNSRFGFSTQQDIENENAFCQAITAWDTTTGAKKWQFDEDKIDPTKVVVSEDRVYLYAKLSYAACLDMQSGTQIWKTPAPIAYPKGPGMGLGWALNAVYTPRQGAIVTKDAYLINYDAHLQCQAFAAGDGHLLWDRMHGKTSDTDAVTQAHSAMLTYPLVLGNTVVSHTFGTPAIDLLSGKPATLQKFASFSYGGCGHFAADANGLCFGQLGNVFDSLRGEYLVNEYSKAACGVSQFLADGMIVKVPADCGGCGEWRGYFAVSPLRQDAPAAPAARLEPGHAGKPGADTVGARDWPTYRAQNDRRASSAAILPLDGAIRWTYTPPRADSYNAKEAQYLAPDREAAPPISVGTRVWLGTAEGAVVCLNRADGKELWRYWTAGRIMSSPSWDGGRVYAGSCDGRVYCLDAATGALIWRYRVAPLERRVMITGMLSSAWPVLASPLVHDGVVYAAAGYVAQLDGSCLCALDAQTGNPRWEQQFGTHSDVKDALPQSSPNPPTAGGQLAWALGRLWWKAGDWGVAAIDPATGKILSAGATTTGSGSGTVEASGKVVPTAAGSRGQEIGILPGGWVVSGGRQFILPPEAVAQQASICSFVETNTLGLPTPKNISLTKSHVPDALPAWDDQEVLLCGAPGNNLTLSHTFLPALTAAVDAPTFHLSHNLPLTDCPLELPADQQRQVLPDEIVKARANKVYTPILAKNAVIYLGVYTMNGQSHTLWHLYVVSRDQRKVLWVVSLPTRPVIGGLALTRDGDVLVPLIDGQVICAGVKKL